MGKHRRRPCCCKKCPTIIVKHLITTPLTDPATILSGVDNIVRVKGIGLHNVGSITAFIPSLGTTTLVPFKLKCDTLVLTLNVLVSTNLTAVVLSFFPRGCSGCTPTQFLIAVRLPQ